jgi:hypothetical protein
LRKRGQKYSEATKESKLVRQMKRCIL